MSEDIPLDMQSGGNWRGWLLAPSELTHERMVELAVQTFSSGPGLLWLEGFMWQIMFATPSDQSEAMSMRDVGKQDVLRIIVAMIHQGLSREGRNDG